MLGCGLKFMRNFKIFLITILLGLMIVFLIFVFLIFPGQKIQIIQEQIIQSYADFRKGTLENLTILEIKNDGKMTLKIAHVDFEKFIVADNFLSARSVHAVDIDRDGKIDILGTARYIHQIA